MTTIEKAENGLIVELKEEENESVKLVYATEAENGGLNAEAVRNFLYDLLELLDIREDKGRYSREVIRIYTEVGDKYQPLEDEEIYKETIYKIRKLEQGK